MKATLRKGLLAAAAAGAMVVGANGANAGLLVDGWTFDFTAASLAGEGLTDGTNHVISGIQEVNFLANVHALSDDSVLADGIPTAGESFTTTGIGFATQFSDFGGDISPFPHNQSGSVGGVDGFEVTFKFKANGTYTSLTPDGAGGFNASFVHTACADCKLELWVDNLNSGGTADAKIDIAAGTGATDGTKFAEFELLPLEGGVFNTRVLDGTDNTIWRLTDALAGVIIDTNTGIDVSTIVDSNGDELLVALVDSNFNNDDPNGVFSPCNAEIGGPTPANETANDLCVREDGSFTLQIPEPATLGLMGTGLVALGAFYRRRRTA